VAVVVSAVRRFGSGSDITTLASPPIVTIALTVGALTLVAVAVVVMTIIVHTEVDAITETTISRSSRGAIALVAQEVRFVTEGERGSCGTRWTSELAFAWGGWARVKTIDRRSSGGVPLR